MSQTLVAVCAHADDAELNAGGTLAKSAGQGARIHIVMVTNNCSGFLLPEDGDETKKRRLNPDTTRTIRHQEQEAAAALIGAEVHYLDYPQRHYWDEAADEAVRVAYTHDRPAPEAVTALPILLIACQLEEHIRRLSDLLVSLNPDLIIAQPPVDLDPEHHAVAAMTWSAVKQSRDAIPDTTLRFWTPGSSCIGGLFDPQYDHLEDITDWFDKKLELCAAHRSQMTEFRWNMVKKRAAAWGEQIGVPYAEPFRTANV